MFKRKLDPSTPKILRADIEHFLDEPVGVGSTPAKEAFHPGCLLSDLTRNPEFVLPAREEGHSTHARQKLLPWFAQEEMFASFMVDVDRDLEDPSWKDYVPTILVHGDRDHSVPLQASTNLAKVIGKSICASTFDYDGESAVVFADGS